MKRGQKLSRRRRRAARAAGVAKQNAWFHLPTLRGRYLSAIAALAGITRGPGEGDRRLRKRLAARFRSGGIWFATETAATLLRVCT